jgi:signal transduction histidine kinase
VSSPGQGELPPASPTFNRIATTAAVAVLVVLAGGVIADLPGRSPAVVVGALTALLISSGCVARVVLRPVSDLQATIGLLVAGVAGAVLTLLPGGPGFVIVCLAMAGLGMRLVPVRAVICGLVVFAAVNLAFLLTGGAHSLASLASEDVGVAFVFAVGAFTRSSRISQEKARAAQARAEELLEQLRASQLAQAEAVALSERARLAREIHDILAHALSGLVLALDTMELLGRQSQKAEGAGCAGGAGGRPPAGNTAEETTARMLEQVGRAQRIARDGLADTRQAIAALRGEELPGPARLPQLVQETSAVTGIKAVLAVTGEQRPLPPEIGLAVYRTAQEALVNTAKYAGPGARAELSLRYGTDDIELAVQDERAVQAKPPGPAGQYEQAQQVRSADVSPENALTEQTQQVRSPDVRPQNALYEQTQQVRSPDVRPENALTFGGYGLTGMRERAELLGGKLTAGPTETGFGVCLRLPADPEVS